jgi:fucose permease
MPTIPPSNPVETPSLTLMALALVLAGLATMLLGPILPIFAHQWLLTDAQTGQLLLAQFLGATLGGATLTHSLARDFLLGLAAAFAGFLALAFAPTLIIALPSLLLAGFGVGRIIASVNIIAGNRSTQHRGSALARLNIAFSVGCLLSPLLAASLTSRFPLSRLLTALAALFAVTALALALESRKSIAQPATETPTRSRLLNPVFLLFTAVLFLYGGLETSLGGWFTTFTFRYGQLQGPHALILSQSIMVLLLGGLILGRTLATWLLLHIREATLLRIALTLTILAAAALSIANGAIPIALLAILLGIVLAPIFPAAFALYMATQPTSRQAGLVLAASGLGAAAIPWLMGVVSTQSGSIRVALTLPIAAAAILLLLTPLTTPKLPPSLENSKLSNSALTQLQADSLQRLKA